MSEQPARYPVDRPEIEYSKTVSDGLKSECFFIKVKGKSLEDCKKYFDEIFKEVVISE